MDKNRPLRHVGLNKEETDAYMGQQKLKQQEVFALVGDTDDDDDEEEEDEKNEGVAMEQIQSEKISLSVTANGDDKVSVHGADESLVSTSAVSPSAIPAFNMDSDTDVEGEEEEEERETSSAAPATPSTDQQVDRPTVTRSFHMNSDTDVDENEVPGCLASATTKPFHDIPAVRAEDIYMDSDTDVEDDAEKQEAPVVSQNAHTGVAANAVAAAQLEDFNLDSDTDVDEELDKEANRTSSRLDTKAVEVKPSITAPPSMQTDSETDDEAAPAANGKVCGQKTGAEDGPPRVAPSAVTASSLVPAALSGSEADADVGESSGPRVGNEVCPTDLHLDSDTDVDEDEGGVGVTTEDQVPSLCRTNTPGFQDPPLQKCSTPVYLAGKRKRFWSRLRTTHDTEISSAIYCGITCL